MTEDKRVVLEHGIVTHIRYATVLETLPTYRARCCKEWDIPLGPYRNRCGLCGEVPKLIEEA